MIRYDAVVRLARIEVLDQVVPGAPLPDDFGSGRIDLDDTVKPEIAALRQTKSGLRPRAITLSVDTRSHTTASTLPLSSLTASW